MVLIDYLGLIKPVKAESRHDLEIGAISRELKALAKDLNVPVMVLSQLSRSVEQRENKRPILSDLRDSGSLEQDADVVMFVYRDEYYHPSTEKKGVAEVIIAKQRQGATGAVELAWIKECTKFASLEKEETAC